MLGFATIEGARTVGLQDKIGSITPGKSADLILIPRHALNLAPMADPIAALVLGGHAGNVEAVIVEGRPVKWNGRMIGIDRAAPSSCSNLPANTSTPKRSSKSALRPADAANS